MKNSDVQKISAAYHTLGLAFGADITQIKIAKRKLVQKYHPDKHKTCLSYTTQQFNKIIQATNILLEAYKYNNLSNFIMLTNNHCAKRKAEKVYNEVAKYR